MRRYLDASCLLFGPNKEFLEVIDFDRRMSSSKVGTPGAHTSLFGGCKYLVALEWYSA